MKWLRNILVGLIALIGLAILAGIFAIVVLIFPPEAKGDTLYTGAVSNHVGGGDYCEVHPLLAYEGGGYMGGGYMGGVFRNSYCDWTAFAGRRFAWQPDPSVELAATVGAMVGYRDHVVNVAGVSPLIMLEAQARIDWSRPATFLLGNALAFVPGWRVD